MGKIVGPLLTIFLLSGMIAAGSSMELSYRARSGDKELDLTLNKLNVQAEADREGFISDLSISYGFPKPEIRSLFVEIKMLPADVYMTLKTARLINKPLEVVVKEYKAKRGKGWGVIAKSLGIKPGSEAFHALKNDAAVVLEKAKVKGKEGPRKAGDKSKTKGAKKGKAKGRKK